MSISWMKKKTPFIEKMCHDDEFKEKENFNE